MKSIWRLLSMLCVIVTFTVAGLAAFLLATNKLSPEKRELLVKVVRGEELFPADEDAAPEPVAKPLSEEESLSMSEKAVARTALLTSRQIAELEYKQRQLENLQTQVQQQKRELKQLHEEIAQERQKLAEDLRASRSGGGEESFKRELKLYEQMAPKQVRDIFMGLPEKLAAEFMAAMKPQVLVDVLASFKSEEEKVKAQKLLAVMRKL